ncbi:MAG: hypothetical protein U0234_28580 [Sandaracinus sp.]
MQAGPSALSDVIAVLRRAGLLLRARPGLAVRGAIAGVTVPFAMVLVGIPLLGTWLVTSYRVALDREEDRSGAGWGVLALAGVAHGVTQLMMLVATALAITVSESRGAVATAVVSTVALAPIHAMVCGGAALASTAVAAASVRAGLAEGVARMLAVLRARPLSLLLALALQIALQTFLCVGIGLLLADHPMVAQGIAIVTVGISHLVLAAATEIEVLRLRPSDTFGMPTRALAIGLALPASGFVLALALSFAMPMSPWSEPPPLLRDAPLVDGRLVLRADTGLAVEVHPSGSPYAAAEVLVTRADGGGAGRISGLGFSAVRVLETRFRGRHAWAIGGQRAVVYVDDEGARLDDTLGDRFEERAAEPLAFALIATLLAGIVALRIRRTSAHAALLGASDREGEIGSGAPRAVLGKLSLAPGARIAWLEDDRVEVRGAARFEGEHGAYVVPLPEGAQRLEGAAGNVALDDGAPAFAVFPAVAQRARSYREAGAAAPLLLGVGTLNRAREAYLTHASRLLLRQAVPAAALYVLASIVLAFRWL